MHKVNFPGTDRSNLASMHIVAFNNCPIFQESSGPDMMSPDEDGFYSNPGKKFHTWFIIQAFA